MDIQDIVIGRWYFCNGAERPECGQALDVRLSGCVVLGAGTKRITAYPWQLTPLPNDADVMQLRERLAATEAELREVTHKGREDNRLSAQAWFSTYAKLVEARHKQSELRERVAKLATRSLEQEQRLNDVVIAALGDGK